MRLGGVAAGGAPAVAACAAAVAACGVAVARARLLVVTVRGGSMRPALDDGDHVLVLRRGGMSRPKRGRIVVCHSPHVLPGASAPGGLIVKRVVAVAGEHVPCGTERGAGKVVPAGFVYLMGDAADSSTDSRDFGAIPWSDVLGTVIRRLPAPRPRALRSPMPGDGRGRRSDRPPP